MPRLERRVTDLVGALDSATVASLDRRLAEFEARKGAQVAVLIVPTTQPETIEQFSIRVADQWKLGRRGVDDGVLFLVAYGDHALRIEVGYGLEGALPDAVCKRIIDQFVVPRLRAGDFNGGVTEGVEKIIKTVEGEPLPPPPSTAEDGFSGDLLLWWVIVVVLFVMVLMLKARGPYGGRHWTSGSRGGSGRFGGGGWGGGFGGGGGGFGGGGASGRW